MKMYQLLVPAMVLALILTPCSSLPQSGDETIRLWNEAYKIETGAKTRQEREKAAKLYEEVLARFEKQGKRQNVWAVATNLGRLNCDLGQYASAREYYQKAVDVAKSVASVDGQAQGLNGLGCVCWELGKFDKAITYFRQALEAYKNAGNTEGEAFTLNHIGEAYREQGQYAEAVTFYEKGLEISKKIASPEGEADVLHNLGEVSRLRGQYREAMDYYSKALTTYRLLGDTRHEGITLSNIGIVYGDWGRPDKAIEYYQQALAVFNSGGIIREEARTTMELGRIHQAREEYEEALAAFERARDLHKGMGVETSTPMKLIADLYLDMQKPKEAEPFVSQAKDPVVSGRLYITKGAYEEARRQYAKLLESAQTSGNVEELFTAHTGLGSAYEELQDYRKAEDHYKKGMGIVEEIRSRLLPAERKRFYNVRVNGFYRSAPAEGVSRVKMKLNEAGDSIATCEATRSRAFVDRWSGSSEAGFAGVPVAILAQERDLNARIVALKNSRASVPKERNPDRYAELSRDVVKAENELKAFVLELRKNYPHYAAFRYPPKSEPKNSALRADECVVMLDVDEKGVKVWLIKNRDIVRTSYEKWPEKELEAAVHQFRDPFENGGSGEFDPEMGHLLYRKLLLPVLIDVPPGTHLIIMPQGVLAALPFEALVVTGKETWKKTSSGAVSPALTYLGDVYPISYHQSITALTLARTRNSPNPTKDKALVLADPIFGPDDDRLHSGEREELKLQWQALPANIMSAACTNRLKFRRLALTGWLGP